MYMQPCVRIEERVVAVVVVVPGAAAAVVLRQQLRPPARSRPTSVIRPSPLGPGETPNRRPRGAAFKQNKYVDVLSGVFLTAKMFVGKYNIGV